MPGKPLISVVTVVFNRKKYLEETVSSVANQTYGNVEYIIIDGGSTDGSLEIIKKYEERIDYWQSEPDRNYYDAMNKGVQQARGDWIHILNSDDYYLNNNVLEKASKCLDESGKYFYYFTLIHKYPDGHEETYKHPYNFLMKPKLYYSAYIPHPTLFVMKKHYNEIGLYDCTNYNTAADHELILRLSKIYKPVFVDIPLTVMRIGGHSNWNIKHTFEEFKKATIKHGLNPFLAELIFRFKVFKYRVRNLSRLSRQDEYKNWQGFRE